MTGSRHTITVLTMTSATMNQTEKCYCRRCLKDDPGGCLEIEKVWQSQVDRGIISESDYFIAKDENGRAL